MSITKRYTTIGGTVWTKRNNIDDVLDTNRFLKVDAFRPLFGTRSEKEGVSIAKKILCVMLKMLADDLVENNDAFLLPRKGAGMLVITDLARHRAIDIERYDRDHIDDRKNIVYGGVVKMMRPLQTVVRGKNYFFKLVTPYLIRMHELRAVRNMTWR
jgi:hypothetical protein